VNFLYDDIVHALQNTIDSSINSATDRRGYMSEHRFTKFSEITQCNDHYVVQDHSRSPILVPIERAYTDFLLVINTNVPPISHRFHVIIGQIFASESGAPHFNAGGDSLPI